MSTHLVPLGHQEVEVVAWQGHLQVGLDQSQVSRVALEAVDANNQVKVSTDGASVLLAVVEVRHRRRETREVAVNKN